MFLIIALSLIQPVSQFSSNILVFYLVLSLYWFLLNTLSISLSLTTIVCSIMLCAICPINSHSPGSPLMPFHMLIRFSQLSSSLIPFVFFFFLRTFRAFLRALATSVHTIAETTIIIRCTHAHTCSTARVSKRAKFLECFGRRKGNGSDSVTGFCLFEVNGEHFYCLLESEIRKPFNTNFH